MQHVFDVSAITCVFVKKIISNYKEIILYQRKTFLLITKYDDEKGKYDLLQKCSRITVNKLYNIDVDMQQFAFIYLFLVYFLRAGFGLFCRPVCGSEFILEEW